MRNSRVTAIAAAAALGVGTLAVSMSAIGSPAHEGGVAEQTTGARQVGSPGSPADFTDPKANPYFPLRPGLVTRMRGSEDDERFRERVKVTHQTKMIEGVRTRVVRDVVHRADGSLAERTVDWYAADNRGNIWYFGEATATYDENGKLEDREGSWRAGRDGAVAGLIMPANPRPTLAYRQETYRRHAEDQAWIVQRHAHRTVPYRTFRLVVRSFEWTRLEPRVLSTKFYARGVGIVFERDVAGGSERFWLVDVRRP